MFYEPKNGHGLPHNPFGALISPRPIGWISTRSAQGQDNLAPYSFFNAVAYSPPQVMFSSTSGKPDRARGKDTVANILETGVFCVNLVSYALRDAMNASSAPAPREVDEFDLAQIARADCETIPCSRVMASPANLECRLIEAVTLPGAANIAIFGEVTGVHIDDAYLKDGEFDQLKAKPLARLGYQDYTSVTQLFSLARPET